MSESIMLWAWQGFGHYVSGHHGSREIFEGYVLCIDMLTLLDPIPTPISNLRYLILSSQPIHGAQSLRLFPSHRTLCSPSTFDYTQLYLGDPSIISAYPALIANVTRFSIQ